MAVAARQVAELMDRTGPVNPLPATMAAKTHLVLLANRGRAAHGKPDNRAGVARIRHVPRSRPVAGFAARRFGGAARITKEDLGMYGVGPKIGG